MTTLPAVVTITDLPLGTTLTGGELLEAVQTVSGVQQSIQITISQIATTAFGGLPSGGATGQFLRSLGTGFAAAWASIGSTVLVGTGLSAATTATTVTLSLGSTAGLSVLGVGGTSTAVPAAIVGTANQVLVVNPAGTAALFGAVNLAATAAVTGVLSTANMTAINLATTGGGGVTGILPAANMTAVNVGTTGAGGIQGQPFFQPTTALPAAGSTALGIRISSAANLGLYFGTGTPTFTAGTGSLYINGGAASSTTRLYINTNGVTNWTTFTAAG